MMLLLCLQVPPQKISTAFASHQLSASSNQSGFFVLNWWWLADGTGTETNHPDVNSGENTHASVVLMAAFWTADWISLRADCSALINAARCASVRHGTHSPAAAYQWDSTQHQYKPAPWPRRLGSWIWGNENVGTAQWLEVKCTDHLEEGEAREAGSKNATLDAELDLSGYFGLIMKLPRLIHTKDCSIWCGTGLLWELGKRRSQFLCCTPAIPQIGSPCLYKCKSGKRETL